MELVCVKRICVDALYHADLNHLISILQGIIFGWTYCEQINTLVYKFAAVLRDIFSLSKKRIISLVLVPNLLISLDLI